MPQKKSPHVLIHRLHTSPYRHFRLGRHIVHDPRSLKFPAKKARAIKSVDHLSRNLPLDQGNIGSCTANAALAAMLTEPYFKIAGPIISKAIGAKGDLSVLSANALEPLAVQLYHDETELHPRDGVYPPSDPGGCGLWIAKVLKNRGFIKGYSHAFGLTHALRALVLRPVILGVDWYTSFDEVDEATGLIEVKPHARADGGHEFVAVGIDAAKKLVWCWQSWGKWGYKNSGRFCMTWDTLDFLLKNQGDCTQFTV